MELASADRRYAPVEKRKEAFVGRRRVDDIELFEAIVGKHELLVVVYYRRFNALYEACVVRGEEVEEVAECLGGERHGEVLLHKVVLVDVWEEVLDNVKLVGLLGTAYGEFVVAGVICCGRVDVRVRGSHSSELYNVVELM